MSNAASALQGILAESLSSATMVAALLGPPAAAVLARPERVEIALREARAAIARVRREGDASADEAVIDEALDVVGRACRALFDWERECIVIYGQQVRAVAIAEAGKATREA